MAERTFTTKKEFYSKFEKKSMTLDLLIRFFKNKTAMIGLVIFLIILLAALFAPLIADYENMAIKINVQNRLQPPGGAHLLGTDEMGRDIFARIVHGARISLLIGAAAVSFALLVGGLLGSISGYYGGMVDNIIMRCMDIFLCLPESLLALALVASFGTNQINLITAIGLSLTPKMSRVVRSAIMSVRDNEYVEAARSIGARDHHIISQHVLVNCMGPIIVQVTLYIATAILTISGLSFLGLGIPVPIPEWGNMLASGRNYIRDASFIVIAPGLAIFITILSLNLLGDGLRDTLDPKLKQ